MITIKNLSKKYADHWAVRELNLEVKEAEIFALLGVNGAGKTTILKMLTGVLKPTSGSIQIAGFDLHKDPEKVKALIGYVPDRPYLYNKLTGREFLYFIADLHSMNEVLAEEQITELLKKYALINWQDELIESYSHGMKQRLALCSGLLHQPKVLIVDEPIVGLDPHGAKLLKESFRDYAEKGMAILLSTHSLNIAEELADRLAIISQGKIIASGTVAEIKALVGGENKKLEEVFLQLTWESLEVAEL